MWTCNCEHDQKIMILGVTIFLEFCSESWSWAGQNCFNLPQKQRWTLKSKCLHWGSNEGPARPRIDFSWRRWGWPKNSRQKLSATWLSDALQYVQLNLQRVFGSSDRKKRVLVTCDMGWLEVAETQCLIGILSDGRHWILRLNGEIETSTTLRY